MYAVGGSRDSNLARRERRDEVMNCVLFGGYYLVWVGFGRWKVGWIVLEGPWD